MGNPDDQIDALHDTMNTAERMRQRILQRKQEKEEEKAQKYNPYRGRVVGSYYTAQELDRLQVCAELDGVAKGGLQHEATMLYVEASEQRREYKKKREQEVKEKQEPTVSPWDKLQKILENNGKSE